uniref:organelle RRM domain-containing protein 2, mitochondrial n=1 Tax=Erigeron canadensis TaxID=72917 RepID=UPI001CB9643F|nr:organelle RRM domain-containing protein 2, mitochondrial [Erigeron canadensis]
MAIAMTRATTVAATAGSARGLRSLFSTVSTNFPFASQTTNQPQRPQADPSTNLFVSGLSKRTTDEGLRDAFAKFGEVIHARVVKDRASGWSKGFGFVRYSTLEGAAAGIEGMDGKFLDGWVIFAEYARPRDAPPPPPSYGNNPYGNR